MPLTRSISTCLLNYLLVDKYITHSSFLLLPMKLSSPVSRLRIISLLDAISYVYLAFCAIYLKRMLGDETAVRIPGIVHAILFSIFCVALLDAWRHKKWTLKTVFLVFLTCLVPLVPFWLEGWLKKQED